MKEEQGKAETRGDPKGLYEELCGKSLTKEQQAEMTFNLVNFMETLIAMDRQHKEWLKNQNEQTKEIN